MITLKDQVAFDWVAQAGTCWNDIIDDTTNTEYAKLLALRQDLFTWA
jgi:hypothetical protein